MGSLMEVMLTLVSSVYGTPLTETLFANFYSVGFIFVILGRSELFTEQTTLGRFPVLDGRAALSSLVRLWELIYGGHVIGAVNQPNLHRIPLIVCYSGTVTAGLRGGD